MYDVFGKKNLETLICVFLLIPAMELALALGKLVNEKLHNLHSVSCSYCIACT
jgi:ABC-type Fe3+ transport system permease subunit